MDMAEAGMVLFAVVEFVFVAWFVVHLWKNPGCAKAALVFVGLCALLSYLLK